MTRLTGVLTILCKKVPQSAPRLTRLRVKIFDQNNPCIVVSNIAKNSVYQKCKDSKEFLSKNFKKNVDEWWTCPFSI